MLTAPAPALALALTLSSVVMIVARLSSAFVLPRPGLVVQRSSYACISVHIRARTWGELRRTARTGSISSLCVLLEQPASTTSPPEKDGLIDSIEIEASLAVMPGVTENALQESGTPGKEVPISLGETGQHTEVQMGDGAKELTRRLVEPDPHCLVSPSVPISFDELGMVQADGRVIPDFKPFPSAIARGTAGSAPASDDANYPSFITFLYQRDAEGRTLASKIFNAILLAASFGYVLATVFGIDRGMTRGWTPGEIGMRIPLDTWASYENSLSEKPVATKTIINIVIYLLGDWLSQTFFLKKNVLDFNAGRTLKNGFVGMCFGPAVHEYYEFSDWILPVDGATLGMTNRAFKILMDQTVYLLVKCSIYIMAIGILNGESLAQTTDNVKNRIKPIMFTAWKFWPLVHCVTYGLIPSRHRILWVNSVDLVWNAILASKARDDDDRERGGEEACLDGDIQERSIVLDINGNSGEGEVTESLE